MTPHSRQCRRPAIIRCKTSQSSPCRPMQILLPILRNCSTRLPSTAETGGIAVRSSEGLTIRMRASSRPTMRSRNASIYTSMSGSSGTGTQGSTHPQYPNNVTCELPAQHPSQSHTTCAVFARHSSQNPLSLMSIHSTACEAAMAQRNSWQWVRCRVCPSSCTDSISRRLASTSRSWRQAVELLREAMVGDDGAGAAHLRLAKNKRQNRNVEIALGDGQQPPGVVVDVASASRREFPRSETAGARRAARTRDRAPAQESPRAHGTSRPAPAATTRAGGRPGFPPAAVATSSLALDTGQLSFLAAPAVLLQLVVQGNAVDAQHLGGARLVAAAVIEHAQDVVFLHIVEAARRRSG